MTKYILGGISIPKAPERGSLVVLVDTPTHTYEDGNIWPLSTLPRYSDAVLHIIADAAVAAYANEKSLNIHPAMSIENDRFSVMNDTAQNRVL